MINRMLKLKQKNGHSKIYLMTLMTKILYFEIKNKLNNVKLSFLILISILNQSSCTLKCFSLVLNYFILEFYNGELCNLN